MDTGISNPQNPQLRSQERNLYEAGESRRTARTSGEAHPEQCIGICSRAGYGLELHDMDAQGQAGLGDDD